MSSRHAIVRIGGDDRGLQRTLHGSHGKVKSWAAKVRGDIAGALKGGGGHHGGGGLASKLGPALGFGGVAALGLYGRKVFETEKRLSRLQAATGKSRGEILRFNEAMQSAAAATGISSEQLLAGAEKYQELTGELGQYIGALDDLAIIGLGSQASMEDIAAAAASLSQNLGVTKDQLVEVFDVMMAQGDVGAVEFRDMAGVLAGLAPVFSQFATGAKGAAELGAVMQVVRQGFASTEEAATGVESLMNAIIKNSKKLEKRGVRVFEDDAKTKLRDFVDIVYDLQAIPAKDLLGVLGRSEGYKAALKLLQEGRGRVDELASSTDKLGTIQRKADVMSQSASVKMSKAMEKLKGAFSDAILRNADHLAKLFELIADAIAKIAEHADTLVAVMALSKLGGYVGGLGALGGAGGGGGFGAYGGGALGGGGRGAGRLFGATGSMLRGAGFGFLAASTVGRNLDDVNKGALVAAHALAGLGGPVGYLAAAVGDATLGIIEAKNKALDEIHRKIVDAEFSEFAVDRADEVLSGGKSMSDKRRSAIASVLGKAYDTGAILEVGEGNFQLDEHEMMASLMGDESLSGADRVKMMQATRLAMELMGRDAEVRKRFVNRIHPEYGGNWTGAGPSQFGEGNLTPWSGVPGVEDFMPEPFVFGQGVPGYEPPAPGTPYGQMPMPLALPQMSAPREREIIVTVRADEGLSASVEDGGRRRRSNPKR